MLRRPVQTEAEFTSILSENIRPAQPIDSPALLQGRESMLRDIGRSLQSPGMHVFIHGERGIGKTSLALTAAKSALGEEPPYVGCDKASTFQSLVSDICDVLLDRKHLQRDTKISGQASVGLLGLKAEAKIDGSHKMIRPDEVGSINQAAALIGECVEQRGKDSVLIVDELDRVVSAEFRNRWMRECSQSSITGMGFSRDRCPNVVGSAPACLWRLSGPFAGASASAASGFRIDGPSSANDTHDVALADPDQSRF
jgi:Cdc6-like AAA superfamily ATPase